MSFSPLQFAREFAKLKSRVGDAPSTEQRLLLLVEFWPNLRSVGKQTEYHSYLDEFIPLLLTQITTTALTDLTISELEQICSVLQELGSSGEQEAALRLAAYKLAEINFYVGDTDAALKAACLAAGADFETVIARSHDGVETTKQSHSGHQYETEIAASSGKSRSPRNDIVSSVGRVPAPERSEGKETRQFSDPYTDLQAICEQISGQSETLDQLLAQIASNWESHHDSYFHDRVNCLFIENSFVGRVPAPERSERKKTRQFASRGRLRTLTGNVETRKNESTTDDIAFDNKVRSPDDPFVGVAYDSLAAVRVILARLDSARAPKLRYHAHYNVENSDHEFTGDSIGLALALLSYAQLLKPEMLRLERFISGEVAFTGGINPNGTLTPVNDTTLPAKIERVFFSPLRYVVVPQANAATAQRTIESLQQTYPHRNLKLITANSLSEVIEDHNVVRSEKVCFGEFVVKRTYKYTRTLKVQIPVLIVLLAILGTLLAVLFPKKMPWFDDNPHYVRLTERGFVALNADSVSLWRVDFDCDSLEGNSSCEVGDLDGDGKTEVAFVPRAVTSAPFAGDAKLHVYEHDGTTRFSKDCVIHDRYPVDSSRSGSFASCGVDFAKRNSKDIIVTSVFRSYPDQAHIRFWTGTGDSLGWYINPGTIFVRADVYSALHNSGFLFGGINSQFDRAVLICLQERSTGTAPPHQISDYDSSDIEPGNEVFYIMFPRSDVNTALQQSYNGVHSISVNLDGTIEVVVAEDIYSNERNMSYSVSAKRRVTSANTTDGFDERRRQLVVAGLLQEVDPMSYLDDLRDRVAYWTDTGWVTEGELRTLESE